MSEMILTLLLPLVVWQRKSFSAPYSLESSLLVVTSVFVAMAAPMSIVVSFVMSALVSIVVFFFVTSVVVAMAAPVSIVVSFVFVVAVLALLVS